MTYILSCKNNNVSISFFEGAPPEWVSRAYGYLWSWREPLRALAMGVFIFLPPTILCHYTTLAFFEHKYTGASELYISKKEKEISVRIPCNIS